MRFKVKQDDSGLWAVVSPTGQTAGLAPTSREADIAARGLTAFQAFSTREVAA